MDFGGTAFRAGCGLLVHGALRKQGQDRGAGECYASFWLLSRYASSFAMICKINALFRLAEPDLRDVWPDTPALE